MKETNTPSLEGGEDIAMQEPQEQELHVEAQAETEQLPEESQQEFVENPDEEAAREHGWTEKDNFFGDPANWMDAKTFNRKRNDELYKTRQELRDLKRTLEEFKTYSRGKEEQTRQRAIKDLEARREQAKEEGDIDGIEQTYQAEKDLLGEQQIPPEVQAPQPSLSTDEQIVLDQWLAQNTWMRSHPELAAKATAIGEKNGHLPVHEQLAKVGYEMRKNHPQLVQKPRRAPVNRVHAATTGSITQSRTRKFTAADLPPEALDVGKTLVRGRDYKDLNEYATAYFADDNK